MSGLKQHFEVRAWPRAASERSGVGEDGLGSGLRAWGL